MSDRNEGPHEAERAWLEIEAAAIWELEALEKRDGREEARKRSVEDVGTRREKKRRTWQQELATAKRRWQ